MKLHGNRRTFLKAGALCLPFLESVGASAQAGSIKRILIFHLGHGVPPSLREELWAAAPGPDNSLGPLLPLLQPFETVKENLIALSGINGRGGAHNTAALQVLTGASEPGMGMTESKAAQVGHPSLNFQLANELEFDTPHQSVELGFNANAFGNILWSASGLPMRPLQGPQKAYDTLLQDLGPKTDAEEAARQARQARLLSVVDKSTERLSSLAARVNPSDRQRLEEHAQAMQDLHNKISRSGGVCESPPRFEGDNQSELAIEAMFDIVQQTFSCDLTRVMTFDIGGGQSAVKYPWLAGANPPFAGTDYHGVSHENGDDGFRALAAGWQWHAQKLAKVVSAWAETPDADGGMILDNTVIYWTTENADGLNHLGTNLPLLLIAGKNTGLRQGGVHLRIPGERNVADVLTSLQNYMGVPGNFGQAGLVTGPVTELLA